MPMTAYSSDAPNPDPHENGSNIRYIEGLSEIYARYDAFLIDQWGVLHDGQRPYPGVIDCLIQLRKANKQVLILSNSGKSVTHNLERLASLGIPSDLYSALLTSGTLAAELLNAGQGPFGDLRYRNTLLIGDEQNMIAQQLAVRTVHHLEDADLIYLSALDDSLDDKFYAKLVEQGTRSGIPLICANPDLVRITPNGIRPSAGALAHRYAEAGGKVWMVGKPYPEIYAQCKKLALAEGNTRLLAIGDSLEHDVRGGKAAGVDTLLILGGIHAQTLHAEHDPAERLARVLRLAETHCNPPDWIMPSLQWEKR